MTESEDRAAQADRIRKSRNRVLALSLAAFAILVFFVSLARMG